MPGRWSEQQLGRVEVLFGWAGRGEGALWGCARAVGSKLWAGLGQASAVQRGGGLNGRRSSVRGCGSHPPTAVPSCPPTQLHRAAGARRGWAAGGAGRGGADVCACAARGCRCLAGASQGWAEWDCRGAGWGGDVAARAATGKLGWKRRVGRPHGRPQPWRSRPDFAPNSLTLPPTPATPATRSSRTLQRTSSCFMHSCRPLIFHLHPIPATHPPTCVSRTLRRTSSCWRGWCTAWGPPPAPSQTPTRCSRCCRRRRCGGAGPLGCMPCHAGHCVNRLPVRPCWECSRSAAQPTCLPRPPPA